MLPPLRQIARPAAFALRATRRPTAYGGARLAPFARTIVTKRYTQDHEAVVFDDSTMKGTVHLTNYAQSSLGDVVFVELPTEGTEVAQGDQIGAVESVKAASDIVECFHRVARVFHSCNIALLSQYAPVSGVVEESPEDQGWLCRIKVKDAAEVEKLMDEEAYKAHCES
ncbi:glycine cleavage H-protein-domain-containing protein [Fomitopsis serialis]|uniref:glycine cleavage H-protein-domain-containing protein n=1 Tax=Fomitopsis serialis TaxID=139415 RepID=UPI0020086638|nr:glycine cleavage H-protein-domain-containing protein [Neoantrodia serialis]KAH9937115.1 glycine cleavage H-protein-domain-containing protein [Neoantrodia serialis]